MKLIATLALALCMAAAGCGGPSSAEVQEARSARYGTTPEAALDAAVQGAQDAKWKVEQVDPQALGFRTDAKWFEPDGTSEDKALGSEDNVVSLEDGSILLAFIVYVKGADGDIAIEVQPKIFQKLAGSPQPVQLSEKDASLPGWVTGKIDNLYVSIHQRLKAKMAAGTASAPAPAAP